MFETREAVQTVIYGCSVTTPLRRDEEVSSSVWRSPPVVRCVGSHGSLYDMAPSRRRFRSLPGFDAKLTSGVKPWLVVERSKREWHFNVKLVSRFNVVFVQSKHTSVNRFSI